MKKKHPNRSNRLNLDRKPLQPFKFLAVFERNLDPGNSLWKSTRGVIPGAKHGPGKTEVKYWKG